MATSTGENPYRPRKAQPGRRFQVKEMQMADLREAVSRLETENSSLKSRLDQLRKAAKSTTRVVTRIKREQGQSGRGSNGRPGSGFLPDIKDAGAAPAEDCELLKREIEELRTKLEDVGDARRIERDNYKYTLKERNDEIEALQAQLRSGGAASERAPAPSNNDNDIRQLMIALKAMQIRCTQAEQSAAVCAHLAQVAKQQQTDAEASCAKMREKYREARKKVIQWETERELEGPPPASATRVRVGLLLHNGRWMSPKKDGAGGDAETPSPEPEGLRALYAAIQKGETQRVPTPPSAKRDRSRIRSIRLNPNMHLHDALFTHGEPEPEDTE